MLKRHLIIISVIIASILLMWKNVILNINTHLPGWYDELFIIWIYQNNINHFTSLDFKNLYETNAMFPFTNTLSFAEQMFFPSLFILLISFFAKNPIAQYNYLLVLNHVLVFITSLIFFRKILRNNYAGIVSALYTTFSPYFFVKISHFQMLFFWPMFLSLYFLADYFEKNKNKSLVLSAIFTGLQFLSSVYLGIMSLTITLILFSVQTLPSKEQLLSILKKVASYIAIFLIVSGISVYGYIMVNSQYQARRDYGEYVTYSANLTDYIFPIYWQDSFLYDSLIFKRLKSFNRHKIGEYAVFAGFIPLSLAIYLLFPKIKKIKEEINFNFTLSPLILFSLSLISVGFILSLGPRLFVNGQYTELPLPGDLLLKLFPPVGIIRVMARWHFLVILGFSILLGLGYLKLQERICKGLEFRKNLLFVTLLFLIFLEFYPLNPIPTTAQTWNETPYKFLSEGVCKNSNNNILEYPFHYRNIDANVGKDVNYMAKILLDSTQHKCKTLSGYYSYEPPAYLQIKGEFEDGFNQKDINLIHKLGIDYIKFNTFAISDQEFQKIEKAGIFKDLQKIYDQGGVLIFKTSPISTNK